MADTPKYPKRDHRQEVTDKLIAQLEAGTAPWQKPWVSGAPQGIKGNTYRGGNAVNLMMEAEAKGYEDPRWMTFKQANDAGWRVKKGEKATTIEFWQFKDKEDHERDETKHQYSQPMVRYYQVFNVAQIEGDIPPFEKREFNETEAMRSAEEILQQSGANITNVAGDRAFYSPSNDSITLPKKGQFSSEVAYYATALHELGHWTGHESRLDRLEEGNKFGSEGYAREELRVEIASMMIQSELGLPHNTEQHAAYVGSWIKALKEDKNEIFKASKDANKIFDFVMDFKNELDNEKRIKSEAEAGQTQEPAVTVDDSVLEKLESSWVNTQVVTEAQNHTNGQDVTVQKWASKAQERMEVDPFSDDPIVEAQRKNPRNVQHVAQQHVEQTHTPNSPQQRSSAIKH